MDIEREELRGRWTAALAALSLAAIAVACFLPTVRVGAGEAAVPWDAARQSAEMALLILPPFLLAGALALATAAGMLGRGGPHPVLAWIWIVLLAAGATPPATGRPWARPCWRRCFWPRPPGSAAGGAGCASSRPTRRWGRST